MVEEKEKVPLTPEEEEPKAPKQYTDPDTGELVSKK